MTCRLILPPSRPPGPSNLPISLGSQRRILSILQVLKNKSLRSWALFPKALTENQNEKDSGKLGIALAI